MTLPRTASRVSTKTHARVVLVGGVSRRRFLQAIVAAALMRPGAGTPPPVIGCADVMSDFVLLHVGDRTYRLVGIAGLKSGELA